MNCSSRAASSVPREMSFAARRRAPSTNASAAVIGDILSEVASLGTASVKLGKFDDHLFPRRVDVCWVEPTRSTAFARTAAIGASRPLPCDTAKVA